MEPWIYVLGPALVPAGLLAVLFLLKRPEWSPLTLLLVATITPWSFAKGVTPVLVLTAVLASLRLLQSAIVGSRRSLLTATPRRAATAFGLAACVSALWGWLAMDAQVEPFWTPQFFPVQMGQLAALVLAPAALLLTSVLLTTRALLKGAVIAYLGLTTFGLLLSLVVPAFEVNLRGLVLTWSASLIFGQLAFNPSLDRRIKVLLGGILALTLYVKFVLAFSWVSGWLPTLVAIAVMIAFRSWKAVLAFVVVAAIATTVAAGFLQQDYNREYEESGATRTAKWLLVARQPFVRQHFVLGTGPANYALYFSAYTPRDRLSTHNNFADIFLQMGVVGVGLILWVLISAGRLGMRLRASPMPDPFLRGFVHSTIGGIAAVLVSMMLGDWFTPFVYNQTLAGFSWTIQSWIFIGALCAVPTILRGEGTPARGTLRPRLAPLSFPTHRRAEWAGH